MISFCDALSTMAIGAEQEEPSSKGMASASSLARLAAAAGDCMHAARLQRQSLLNSECNLIAASHPGRTQRKGGYNMSALVLGIEGSANKIGVGIVREDGEILSNPRHT